MYCPSCGVPNDDNAFRCHECNVIIQPIAPAQGKRIEDEPVMRMLLPVGRSPLAIAAGYAGLFAVLVIPAPLALLLGILAVREIRRNPAQGGMGRAIFGIIMGSIFTVIMIFGIISIMI